MPWGTCTTEANKNHKSDQNEHHWKTSNATSQSPVL